ncbi:uncharacterized protein [Macrobrachium rosenbergii]|uniref:uncharacterized protein isoform X1 n=2 Tax=Macrobrachium rosenbergii TaxID=79674 RepID=UPI0034D42907
MDYRLYTGKPRKPVPHLPSPRMPVGEVHKTFKIFCGNLAGAATKEDLHYLFSQYGPVIEAVVMAGKFYGFVHMAYEEDGWKAICELRGYILHGKAMAVEASINSKKAAPLYKQNIIGKGISALDDFNEFNSSKGKNFESREPRPQSYSQSKVPESRELRQEPPTNSKLPETRELRGEHFSSKLPEPREKLPEPRETREAFPPFKQAVSSSSLHAPPGLFSYPPPFSVAVSSSQPSPIGHTPSSLSQVSPLSDYQMLKTFDAVKDRGSPKLKVQSVDTNSSPQNTNTERIEKGMLCGMCGAEFDEWQRMPKVLTCGHTFCCDCLISLSRDTEIKCPAGCAYVTLTNSGISGLSTNSSISLHKQDASLSPSLPIMTSGYGQQNGAQSRAGSSPLPMVCCTCPKIAADDMCSSQGHQLIPEDQARDLLSSQLQTTRDLTLKQLRHAMSMRASMKERLERTVHSVEKFVDELRRKVEGEQLEEAVLQEHLADLTRASEALTDENSLPQIIESLQTVHSYNSIISSQINQCAAITAINNATEAIVIKLKQSALDSVLSSIGFRNEEAFVMNSSLEQHALYGNNANVLLLYMLSDLLSSRMLQLNSVSPISPISPNQQTPISVASSLQSHMSPSITSTSILDNSLGLSHGKLGGLKSHEISTINLEHILQTTEAIEAGSLLGSSDGIAGMSAGAAGVGSNCVTSALSLGLSNLSLLASEPSENGREELESLTDKKEPHPVSYVDAAKKPAKPTPPPPTPPENSTKMPIVKPVSPMVKSGKFPHCWMVLSVDGVMLGRIVFELRPDKAPRMCDNFVALCTGRNGYGYKGTHFFKSGEGFLAGGDVENDDGTGGYSAFDKTTFEADLCPLKDEVGMVRFKGVGTSESGRGLIGSQFMIWCEDREFKKFSFSLVFGKVVDGLDVARKAAALNVQKVSVKVEECGAV